MREVLDQEGLWKLVRTEHTARYESWVTHDCPPTYMEIENPAFSKTHFASCHSSQKCPICYEKIPKRLIALWTLHNFDHIQENA